MNRKKASENVFFRSPFDYRERGLTILLLVTFRQFYGFNQVLTGEVAIRCFNN